MSCGCSTKADVLAANTSCQCNALLVQARDTLDWHKRGLPDRSPPPAAARHSWRGSGVVGHPSCLQQRLAPRDLQVHRQPTSKHLGIVPGSAGRGSAELTECNCGKAALYADRVCPASTRAALHGGHNATAKLTAGTGSVSSPPAGVQTAGWPSSWWSHSCGLQCHKNIKREGSLSAMVQKALHSETMWKAGACCICR